MTDRHFAKVRDKLIQAIVEDATGTLANEWYTENALLYDKSKNFYRFHKECLKVFRETVVPKDVAVIDFAMGTGVMGELLRDAGYTGPIDGVDRNTAMMEIARSKDIYRNIWNADIGFDKIECIEDGVRVCTSKEEYIFDTCYEGSYDFGVAASCLGRGHIDLTAIPTLIRTLKKGGCLVCTLSGHQLQFNSVESLKDHCNRWDREGLCHMLSCVQAEHTPEAECYVFVLQRW